METTKQTEFKEADMSKNEELFKRFEIEDTPFEVLYDSVKDQYCGVLGMHRLTKFYGDLETCKTATEMITWNRILQVIGIINENINKLNQISE